MIELSTVTGIFNKLYQSIIGFLPGSPFKQVMQYFSGIPYLKYLNWFLPITEMLAVLQAWLAVVAIYYTYSAIMRFIRIL